MSLRFKRGTTVRLRCTHTLGGNAVDLTGYEISASARAKNTYSFTVEIDADQETNPGVFTMTAETESWQPESYRADVRFVTAAAERYYSETFQIEIVEPIT